MGGKLGARAHDDGEHGHDEGGDGEHDLELQQLVAMIIQLQVDVVLRVVDVILQLHPEHGTRRCQRSKVETKIWCENSIVEKAASRQIVLPIVDVVPSCTQAWQPTPSAVQQSLKVRLRLGL